jgi:2-polyprenyl-6-methoxyphenol hydroxylase-like FAD-dependent oxidoreductase
MKVLVSGAGIAGSALAFWLHREGAEVTVVERAPAFREGGYMIDVWGAGYEALERMGLLERVRERAYSFDRLAFVNERGAETSSLEAEWFAHALGQRFFSVPRGDLARVLFEALPSDLDVRFGATVSALRDGDEDIVATIGEREERFDLVVGADGSRSHVRELTFGPIASFEKFLGYWAASFVADDYPHRDEGVYVSFARPGRQISRYALRENRTAFLIVASAGRPPNAHDLGAQKRLARERFGEDGWESREIVERLEETQELYFDSVSQIHAPRWATGRVVLVGDAAYCPSLLAGAGAAFAMLGAYVLAGELGRAPNDVASAVATYEKRLRPFIEKQQASAASFAGSFAPSTTLGLTIRDLALKAMRWRPLAAWYAKRTFAQPFEW